MTIRDAVAGDSVDIARLASQLGYNTDIQTIAGLLAKISAQSNQLVIVAVMAKEVVGWLQAHASEALVSGLRAEIVALVVSEQCRGCGIGRSLVSHAECWAMAKGAVAIVVRSNVKRSQSHLFYPALGFSETKVQAVYQKSLVK